MEKKKKRAPERKLTRTTIIALVVIVLASVAHIALLWLTPNRPDYYDGNIIYPVMKHWLMIDVAIFFVVVGAYAVISEKFSGWGCGLLGLIIMFNCFAVIIASFSTFFSSSSIEQIDSSRYNDNLYYLVIVRHGDWDIPYTVYVVYECGSLGILCHQNELASPYPEYDYGITSKTQKKFTLSQDESELYVIIGEEEFLVATQSP